MKAVTRRHRVQLPINESDDEDDDSIVGDYSTLTEYDDCVSELSQSERLPNRKLALLNELPKNIFQMPGSFALWQDLIGKQLQRETSDLLSSKIKNYSSAQKYAFATLVVKHGFEAALAMEPVVHDSIAIANYHPVVVSPRRFADASVQVDYEI